MKLKETPALLKTPSGYLQLNAWLGVANKNLKLMQKFMVKIGLSSSSRSRRQRDQFPAAEAVGVQARRRPADEFLA